MALADDIAREMAARNGESAASPPDPLDDLTRRWSEEAGFDLPEEPETSEPPYTPQGVEPPDTNGHGLDALTRKWSEEAGFALPKPAPQPAARGPIVSASGRELLEAMLGPAPAVTGTVPDTPPRVPRPMAPPGYQRLDVSSPTRFEGADQPGPLGELTGRTATGEIPPLPGRPSMATYQDPASALSPIDEMIGRVLEGERMRQQTAPAPDRTGLAPPAAGVPFAPPEPGPPGPPAPLTPNAIHRPRDVERTARYAMARQEFLNAIDQRRMGVSRARPEGFYAGPAPPIAPATEPGPGRLMENVPLLRQATIGLQRTVEKIPRAYGVLKEAVTGARSRELDAIAEQEATARIELGIFTTKQAGNRFQLLADVRGDILDGLPLVSQEASQRQQGLYREWSKLDPNRFPEAQGFFEKTARFGGDTAAFLVELGVARRAMMPAGRMIGREVMGGGTPAAAIRGETLARGTAQTLGAGAIAASEGREPTEAMAGFAPIPAIGRIRGVTARTAAYSAFFGGGAAAAGGDYQDILIQGVMGPLLFSAPDIARFAFRPKGARPGDVADWRGFANSTSPVERMIYRWHKLAEEGRVDDPEVQATGKAITKMYAQTISGEKHGFSKNDVGLLRDFVNYFRPEAVADRWADTELETEVPSAGGVREETRRADEPGRGPGRGQEASGEVVQRGVPQAQAQPGQEGGGAGVREVLSQGPGAGGQGPGLAPVVTTPVQSGAERIGEIAPGISDTPMSHLAGKTVAELPEHSLRILDESRAAYQGSVDLRRQVKDELRRRGLQSWGPSTEALEPLPADIGAGFITTITPEHVAGNHLRTDGSGGATENTVENILKTIGASIVHVGEARHRPGAEVFVGTWAGSMREVIYEIDGKRRYVYAIDHVAVDTFAEEWWSSSIPLSASEAADLIERSNVVSKEVWTPFWAAVREVTKGQGGTPEVLRDPKMRFQAVQAFHGGMPIEHVLAGRFKQEGPPIERPQVPSATSAFQSTPQQTEATAETLRQTELPVKPPETPFPTGEVVSPGPKPLTPPQEAERLKKAEARKGDVIEGRQAPEWAANLLAIRRQPITGNRDQQARQIAQQKMAIRGELHRLFDSWGRSRPDEKMQALTGLWLAPAWPQWPNPVIEAVKLMQGLGAPSGMTDDFGALSRAVPRETKPAVETVQPQTREAQQLGTKPGETELLGVIDQTILQQPTGDRKWLEAVKSELVDFAVGKGITIDGGQVESGSYYLRVRYSGVGVSDPRDFTIRLSKHRGRQSRGKIKIHPWDVESTLIDAKREILRRFAPRPLEGRTIEGGPSREQPVQPAAAIAPAGREPSLPGLPAAPPAQPATAGLRPAGTAVRVGGQEAARGDRPAGQGVLVPEPSGGLPQAVRAGGAQPAAVPGGVERPGGGGQGGRAGGGAGGGPGPVGAGLPAVPGATGVERPGARGERRGPEPGGAGPPAERRVRRPGRSSERDYVIAQDAALFQGGARTRAAANIKAIRLVKQLIAENRPATREEQDVLVQYTGWGALSAIFNPYEHKGFKELWHELRGLLTQEEIDAARSSTQNAMYTPPELIGGMYEIAGHLGIDGGRVLEPSMGVGHFFGLMPAELRGEAVRVGVEKDLISGQIAKLLYPGAAVHVQPFEKVALPQGYFDLVIGNVPFAKVFVHDPKYPRWLRQNLHDYFFAKAADLTRPGGIVALITSRYTMDKQSAELRRYLGERMNLLAAIRLNKKSLPGTEVIADILILQKKGPGYEGHGQTWAESVPSGLRTTDGEELHVNEYFVKHPSHVLGTPATTGTMHRKEEYSVEPKEGLDAGEAIRGILRELPAEIARTALITYEAPPEMTASTLPPDAYFLEEGKLYVSRGKGATAEFVEPSMLGQKGKVERIKKLVDIRDTVLELYRKLHEPGGLDRAKELQQKLDRQYGGFIRQHGPLHKQSNVQTVAADPLTGPTVLALENWDPITKKATKGDVFTRELQPAGVKRHTAETEGDALLAVLDESNRIDLDRIGELIGLDRDQARESLLEQELIFETPAGELALRDAYLSGNVRAKLREAESAEHNEPGRFTRNIEALKTVQPADLEPAEITLMPGAPWIPVDVLRDFSEHLFGDKLKITRSEELGQWMVDQGYVKNSVASLETWGHPSYPGTRIFSDLLSLHTPQATREIVEGGKSVMVKDPEATAIAQNKLAEMRAEFTKWWPADAARRKELLDHYNQEINAYAKREYDGQHLTLPGLNPSWVPYPYQKDATYRVIASPSNVLIWVDTGGGKTLIQSMAAAELLRLGIARKPVIVVAKSTLGSFLREARSAYPGLTFIGLDPEQVSAKNRRRTFAKIAATEKAVVVIHHEGFKMIPVGENTLQQFYGEMISDLRRALEGAEADYAADKKDRGKRRTVKQIEARISNLQARLEEAIAEIKKDPVPSFEDMGLDWIFYDESQVAKNLMFSTQMNNVLGLGTPAGNQTTLDLFVKARYVQGLQGGRGLVFSTATPIDNSIVELYSLQRYLQPKVLAEMGIRSLDDWVNMFAVAEPRMERKTDGTYRNVTRLRKFVNVPELLRRVYDFTHVVKPEATKEITAQRGKDVAIFAKNAAGERGYEVEVAAENEDHAAFMQDALARLAAIRHRGGQPQPGEDIILSVLNDERLAALDTRIVARKVGQAGSRVTVKLTGADDPESKVNQAVRQIHEIWEETAGRRSTQLVSINLSTPQRGQWSIYDDIRDKLIAKGVPEAEIAYIQNFPDPNRKLALFNRVNAGDVRILMGNMKTLGVGVNVQQKVIAAHQLDPPWTPAMLKQWDGRFLRTGNENAEVRAFRYVTVGSSDEFMYSLVLNKQRFLHQLLAGDINVREMEDRDEKAASFEMAMAKASGSPLVLELAKLNDKVGQLRLLETGHMRAQDRARRTVHQLQAALSHWEKERGQAQAALPHLSPILHAVPLFEIGGETYDKQTQAGLALIEQTEKLAGGEQWVVVGQYHGRPIEGRFHVDSAGSHVHEGRFRLPTGPLGLENFAYKVGSLGEPAALGYVRRLLGTIESAAVAGERAAEHLTALRKELAEAESNLDQPFPKAAELAESVARREALEKQITEEVAPKAEEIAEAEEEGEEEEREEPKGGGGRGPFPPAAPAKWAGTVDALGKAGFSGEQLAWIRKQGDRPAFGMGGMANLPEMGNRWQRFWTRVVDRLKDLPPSQRKRIVDWFGYGLYGNRWSAPERWWKPFKQWKGTKELALADAEARTADLDAHIELVEEVFREDKRAQVDKLLRDVADKKLPVDRLPADLRLVVQRFKDILRPITQEWIDSPHLWPYAIAAGKVNNIIDVMKGGLDDDALYLRLLYVDRGPVRPARPKRLGYEERFIGPHLRGGQFQRRRSFGGRWHALNADGTYTPFEDYDQAKAYLADALGFDPQETPFEEWAELAKDKEQLRLYKRKKIGLTGGMFHVQLADKSWTAFEDLTDAEAFLAGERRNLAMQWAGEAAEQRFEAETKSRPEPGSVSPTQEDMDHAYRKAIESTRIELPLVLQAVESMEQVTDARLLMTRTIMDSAMNLEAAKLLHQLREMVAIDEGGINDLLGWKRGMGTREKKRKLAEAKGWYLIPDHASYGGLANQWVPQWAWRMVHDTEIVARGAGAVTWDLLTYGWAASKVITNPATWARNLYGQLMHWLYRGISPATHPKLFRDAVEQLMKGNDSVPWRKLVKANKLRTHWAKSELGRLVRYMDDPQTSFQQAVTKFVEWARTGGPTGLPLGKAWDNIARGYNLIDEIGIMASYLHDQRQGASHDEAIDNLWSFMDYADVGPAARWLQRSPIGAQFTSFTDQAIKINLQAFRDRPGRFFGLYAASGLLTLMSMAWFFLNDEDIEAELTLMNRDPQRRPKGPLGFLQAPTDRYFQPLLPFRDGKGRLQTFDLRWIMPLANDFRTVTGPGGLGIPFLFNQPLFKPLMELASNVDVYTGARIVGEKDTPAAAVWHIASRMIGGTLPYPTVADRGIKNLYRAATEGTAEDVIKAVLKEIFGINVRAARVSRQDAFQLIKQKWGEGAVGPATRILNLYNNLYRRPADKPIERENVERALERTAAD